MRREAGGKNSREEGDVAFDVGIDGLTTGGEKFVRWTVGSVLTTGWKPIPLVVTEFQSPTEVRFHDWLSAPLVRW